MNKLAKFNVSSLKTASKPVEVPVNHIFVIDCSGSMWRDLEYIRKQMHNKLATLLKAGDTVSIIWFSGRGEFGKIVEKVHVNDVLELEQLNRAIDRWLKDVGMTGFVEPLKSVKEICNTDEVYSLLFLTDGCDNQWHRSEIHDACRELAPLLSNAVMVEYGFYCNHNLLVEMADILNGSVIFAEDFDRYEPVFEDVCKRRMTNKRIEIPVGKPVFDFVWSVGEGGPITYKVEDGKVYVPEDVDTVYWFTDENVSAADSMEWKPLYQGLSALAMNLQSEFVKKQLSDIGDVHIYNMFSNAFGKQNLYDAANAMLAAGNDSKYRFAEGKKVGLKPKEDAFTVLQLLNMLRENHAKIDVAKLLKTYKRIGRATQTSDELTKDQTKALAESIANAKGVKDIKASTDEMVKMAQDRAKMVFTPDVNEVEINGFSYNENFANISVQLMTTGTVELPDSAPSQLPKKLKTKRYRNYAIVKSGMVNTDTLPVVISQSLVNKLTAKGVKVTIDSTAAPANTQTPAVFGTTANSDVHCTIDVRSLPVINAQMVKTVNAADFAETIYEHMQTKASNKVYNGYLEALVPKERSAGIKDQYGDECADYLKDLGITDMGFAPKVVQAPSVDKYDAVEFSVKFSGLNLSISYNALCKKLQSGKALTASEELLKPAYDECAAKKAAMSEEDFIGWLRTNIKNANKKIETLYDKIVEDKFSIIVGQRWFNDISAETTSIQCHGFNVTFEKKDVQVEI